MVDKPPPPAPRAARVHAFFTPTYVRGRDVLAYPYLHICKIDPPALLKETMDERAVETHPPSALELLQHTYLHRYIDRCGSHPRTARGRYVRTYWRLLL